MKKIIDWFQNHLIAKHLVLAVIVVLGLVAVAYYAMDFGTRHSARRIVPSFVGLAMDDAEHFADRRDLEIVINDSLYVASYPGGVVLEQHPVEGTVVKPGRKIYVTISSMSQRKAVVPYVAKRTLRQALNMLETAGFAIERIDYVHDMATNYVLGEYVGNKEIVQGSTLEAILGSGVVLKVGVAAKATAIAVPQLTGLTIFEAKNRIWESGLNVGEITFDQGIPAIERSNAKVYYQSERPNKMVWYGESISLKLSIDGEKISVSVADSEKAAAEEALKAKLEADSLANINEKALIDSLTAAEQPAPAAEEPKTSAEESKTEPSAEPQQ
ncbi:MAG: PASTA domain-containing protein [Alistipes sp.]|nr:PASTA domain-containing protein [Alistipes sp.]